MQRLKSFYFKEVVPRLQENFGYKNVNQIPKLEKIVINRGFDESCQNNKILDSLTTEIALISGQRPIITKSRKAIASFKVKENMPVGICLTLRGDKMYSFLDRLVNLALPRIRDFQGISNKSFDGSGNYSFGLSEQLMFPEVDFDKIVKVKGMDICIVTSSKTDKEAQFLLKELGMPFNS
uniref:Large ribosomal subunit protein uL5c n=1 Tax=Monomorphina aenigmatica TaxID=304863 RepID=L0BIG9_MONAE|nr:ribosomal protein L5 [Monomorphina aenigmatica]AFZ88806.1 ribosomal protein L5 [Monomorphina aenigmatica]